MKRFDQFWKDESGAIIASEIMLIASVLVVGVTVGLKSMRDSVVTELADVSQALSNVDQSFYYGGTAGHGAFTAGGMFIDLPDFCDLPGNVAYQESKCVSICGAPLHPTGPYADGAAVAPLGGTVVAPGVVIDDQTLTGERLNASKVPAAKDSGRVSGTVEDEAKKKVTEPESSKKSKKPSNEKSNKPE